MLWDLRQFGARVWGERLSICTETSNRLSKRVITSPKLSPKLSELTSKFKITVFIFNVASINSKLQQVYSFNAEIQLNNNSKIAINVNIKYLGKYLGRMLNSGSTVPN